MKNELNLCENENLFRFPFRKRFIIKNLKYIKRLVVSIYQRIKYGISRQDAWDFDYYLVTVIENGLKYLKEEGNSYPGWCSYEEWQTKLSYMIKLGELSNYDYEGSERDKSFDKYIKCSEEFGEEAEETIKAKDDWIKDVYEQENLKYSSRRKLLNEVTKYIDDLWD